MIRVLICDDQDVVCEGLSAILGTLSDIEVVGITYNGVEAIEAIPSAKPDVVLMDLKMPGMNGVQATRQIRDRFPDVRVLVLTTFDVDEWVFDAIRSGASGYLLKDTPREELLKAIKGTAEGKTFIDPDVAGRLLNHIARGPITPDTTLAESLTKRDREVLDLLARGHSNAEIADRLHLSKGTIRNYVSVIFSKLDVADRTQAAITAIRYGLTDLSDV